MNFDRVADIYDQTRALPPGVPERIADHIIALTGATMQTRFLELGVGSGRIALPFAQRGYHYTGVDFAEKMLDRFRAKLQPDEQRVTLVQADVTDLPLPDRSFDVVITVHLLHLVPEWRRTLNEIRRVMVPGGTWIVGNDRSLPGSPGAAIRQQWHSLATSAQATLRPDYGTMQAIEEALAALDAWVSVFQVARWTHEVRPIEVLEAIRNRTFSHSWTVSDETLQQVHEQMLDWAQGTFGPPDQPVQFEDEFTIWATRFGS